MFARLWKATLLTAVLAMAIRPGIAAAAAPDFDDAITKSGGPLISVVIGDFIGDAKLDVAATTTASGGDVLLFEATGTGFEDAEAIETNATGVGDDMHLATGDFNEDTNADLAVSHSGGIDVLRQNAEGTYSSTPITLPGAKAVEAGDVDGDGNEDLVVGTAAAVVVLNGNGDASFDAPAPVGVGAHNDLEVGDFAGDAGVDIAGSSGSTVTAYVRQANGTYQAATRSVAPSTVSSLAIGDFAGDSGNDLAVASGVAGGQVHVFTQEADGGLSNSARNTESENSPQGLAAGDLNGDSEADLAVAHGNGGKVGVYAQGASGLDAESLFTVPSTPSYSPEALAIGNVVGDSRADIVVAGDGELAVLPGVEPVTPSPSPSPTETPDPEELTQEIPYSVWGQPSSTPLDGLGSWLAVNKDEDAAEGQLAPQYAHSQIFWLGSTNTPGLVSLVRDGDDKVATFHVLDDEGEQVKGIPFEWEEGGFYLPLVHRLADGRWGAWIFDWAKRDQGDAAWTFIGELTSPGRNKLSPVSATLSFWFGELTDDCAKYPAAEVLRHPTLGLAGGQGSIANLAGHDAAPGDCNSALSTELDVWEYYRLGD